MHAETTVDKVIDFFLYMSEQDKRDDMTPKKLQKLLYYAYAWGLVYLNDDVNHLTHKLFDKSFEAWVHGPVIPSIYQRYKSFGFNAITATDVEMPNSFSQGVKELLNDIWDVFGTFNANQLEVMTHNETPWKEARGECKSFDVCHNIISDESMFKYYMELSQIG